MGYIRHKCLFPFVWLRRRRPTRDTVEIVVLVGKRTTFEDICAVRKTIGTRSDQFFLGFHTLVGSYFKFTQAGKLSVKNPAAGAFCMLFRKVSESLLTLS